MKTIGKLSAIAAALIAGQAFASDYRELGTEANDALYYLSKYCDKQLSAVKSRYPGAWIGVADTWSNPYGAATYGYNFKLFYSRGFETQDAATLSLSAYKIANPPADGSSYNYQCKINWGY